MAKFDFQGKLYEHGRRVITGVVRDIDVTTLEDPSADASGTLEIVRDGDQPSWSSLKMNLSLPKGEQGEKGDLPKITIGNVNTVSPGNDAKVGIEKAPDGTGYKLNFDIPQGIQGVKGDDGDEGKDGPRGYTPKVTAVREIDVLEPGREAYVEDVHNTSGNDTYDAVWKFHLPKGDKGDPGEAGKPFAIQHVYASIAKMNADDAENNIHPGEYAIIKSNPENEENSQLYYKEYNGNLTYINDFSGARGAHAVALAGTATKLKSTATPTVALKSGNPKYNSSQDQYESTFNFGIPAGASAKVNSVTLTALNSNQTATASVTNTYDSSNDINNAAIALKIPKGASSKIVSVTATTLTPGSAATATAATNYNSSTDMNETTLTLGIPKGSKPNMGVGTTTAVPYGTAPSVEIINDPTGNKDYLLNFSLPEGAKGEKGEAGDIADITEQASTYTAVTSVETGVNPVTGEPDPHYINIVRGGIPTTDITDGIFGVNRGGTGKSSHTLNAVLTGNNNGAVNNVATAKGAFYAESTNGVAKFGTLPVAEGGTGTTTTPSILVNLGAVTPADIFAKSPRPGVTGTLPVDHGGTGLTATPSMLVDLAKTSAADVFTTSPRPGITGTLSIANGGTGATSAASARTNLAVYSKTEIDNAMDNLENSINQKIINEVDESIVISNTEPTSDKTKIWIRTN